uniref:CBM_48 domain-containing protein n=1 Tax=Strongyloides venezuelensis TaxID=75913 RepID=A0A0K0FR71_STRVS
MFCKECSVRNVLEASLLSMSCSNGEYVEMEIGVSIPTGWAYFLYFLDGGDYQVHELPSSKSGVDIGIWAPSSRS